MNAAHKMNAATSTATYMHTYIYTYIHIYIHTYIHTYIRAQRTDREQCRNLRLNEYVGLCMHGFMSPVAVESDGSETLGSP